MFAPEFNVLDRVSAKHISLCIVTAIYDKQQFKQILLYSSRIYRMKKEVTIIECGYL